MRKSSAVIRTVFVGILLSFITLGLNTSLELFGQSQGQDLALVDPPTSISNRSPTPGSTVVINLSMVNDGLTTSLPFSISIALAQIGNTNALEVPENAFTIICTPCATGIAGRRADPDNPGLFFAPTPQSALVIFSTTDLPEGVYKITITLDPNTTMSGVASGANEPIASNQSQVIEIPIFSKPELQPSSLTMTPPSPVPLGAQVRVTAEITNSGQRSVDDVAVVNFSYCLQDVGEVPCQPDQTQAFGSTATAALSLNTTTGTFVDRGTTSVASVNATLDTQLLQLGLYRIAVRTSLTALEEADANNNELTALLTVGVIGPNPEGRSIRLLLVGQNQVGSRDFPIFISPKTDELWALDKANMQKLVSCGGVLIVPCSDELRLASSAFVSPIGEVQIDAGSVRLDVLSNGFSNFDEARPETFIINKWTLPAQVTILAQNPVEPILYVGLSNGTVLRLPMEQLLDRLDTLTAEELLQTSAITVRPNASVTALLPLSNGLVIGTTDNDTQRGQVHFLQDTRQTADLISSATMGAVKKFATTPGFLFVAADNLSGGAPLFFITRINNSGNITTIFRSTTLVGLSGDFTDFVVNRSNRLFMATASGSNGTVFSYTLRASQNTASKLFDPWVGFEDPDPSVDQFLTLGVVDNLQLGDVTPDQVGDEVLYIGTKQQVYGLEIQRQFSSTGKLLWLVNVEGEVTSLAVDALGEVTSGLALVTTADSRFHIVDGRNRSQLDTAPNQTVTLGQPVVSKLFSETFSFSSGFQFIDQLISIYGSDALYFTVELK